MRANLLYGARAGTSLCCILVFTAATQAGVVSGSEGRVTLIGNDAANATGSFSVDVAYEVYDGSSASDPLGATPGSVQIAFALLHNGSGGESPTLAFSRFFVFAPAGTSVSPFYTGISALDPDPGTFLIGPSGNDLDPSGGIAPHTSSGSVMNITPNPSSPTAPNRARWSFTTAPANTSDFQPGQYSRMLVVTADPASFPTNVIIEIDGTMTSPSIKVDQTITLVPEPSAAMLLLAAGTYVVTRRPRRRV